MTKKLRLLSSILLLTLSSILSFRYLVGNDFRLLSLDYYNPEATIDYPDGRELLQGERFTLIFKSKYDHLGTFSLRFNNNFKSSDDTLLFSIRESGSNDPYYQAQYKTDQLLPKRLFDFGFPVIENSKDKNYEVEIASLYGTAEKGIIVDSSKPVFLARSIYSKKDVLSKPSLILQIINNKTKLFLLDKNYLLHLSIYFLPTILIAVSWLSTGLSIHYLVVFYFLSCYFSFRLPRDLVDYFLINYSIYWLYLVHQYRIPKVYTLISSLGFLCLSAILYLFEPALANSFSVWSYFLLVIYLIETIFNFRSHLKNKTNIKQIIRESLNFSHDPRQIQSHLTALVLRAVTILYFANSVARQLQGTANLISKLIQFQVNNREILLVILLFLCLWFSIIWLTKKWIASKEKTNTYYFKILISTIIFISANNYLVALNSKKINSPMIFSVSPNTVSEAWVDISINGSNFEEKPFVGKVFIDGKEQEVIKDYWGKKSVVVRTNPVNTKSGNLCLETYKGVLTNCVPFFYNFGNNKLE